MSHIPSGYIRVTPRNKCPICGRADWCLIHKDGATAICPRTLSDRSWGECGFLHVVDESVKAARRPALTIERPPPSLVNPNGLIDKYQDGLDQESADELAMSLGVSLASLVALRCGWSHQYQAYTFPMYDGLRRVIGIRVRNKIGQKWAVPGSRNGLFVPYLTPDQMIETKEWAVVEGPTDTAACLTLGIMAIGRPSCSAGIEYTVDLLRGKSVVIIGNYDSPKTRPDGTTFYPGQDGAAKLADELARVCKSVRVIYPRSGSKDVREWLANGLTRDELLAVKGNSPPWRVRRTA